MSFICEDLLLVDPFWWVWFLFKKFHFHTKFHLGLWASCPPCGHIITESVHHGFNEVTILTTEFQQNIVCWTWCVISVPLMSLINGGVFVCVYVCVCVFVFVCLFVHVCVCAEKPFTNSYRLTCSNTTVQKKTIKKTTTVHAEQEQNIVWFPSKSKNVQI